MANFKIKKIIYFFLCFFLTVHLTSYAVTQIKKPHPAHFDNIPTDAKININTADTAALMSLKGIGKKRAQAIVDYRQAHGSFQVMADLASVKGFSEKTLTRINKNNPDRVVLEDSKK